MSHPFSALAFLSGLPAPVAGRPFSAWSAWSAGLWPIDPASGTSALWPIDPTRRMAALWPIDPTSGLWPIDPNRRSAAQWPSNPPHAPRRFGDAPQPTAAPSPVADGDDWADGQSMLSQALRKSRARIVRTSDAADKAARVSREALWRWSPDSRVKTIACQVIQRFQVHDRALWLTAPLVGAKGAQAQAVMLYPLPPKLTPKQLEDQIDKVLRAASEREDRLPEILAQAPDFQPFFESITGIGLDRAPRLSELIAVMQGAAVHLVMLLKHEQGAKRPVEASSRVMPVIATPGHGSLPSGHGTMAALTSELLFLLLYRGRSGHEQRAIHLDRLARRIAFNRVVSGVHFPADSKAGYALGTLLARVFAALAGHLAPPAAVTPEEVAGLHLDLPELPEGGALDRPALTSSDVYEVPEAPTLTLLWRETLNELAKLRV